MSRRPSFMQPLSANEAFDFIGKVALGLEPDAAVLAALAKPENES